jgi:hypothetical protein
MCYIDGQKNKYSAGMKLEEKEKKKEKISMWILSDNSIFERNVSNTAHWRSSPAWNARQTEMTDHCSQQTHFALRYIERIWELRLRRFLCWWEKCEEANLLPSLLDGSAAYTFQLHCLFLLLFLLSCRAPSPRDICCNEFCSQTEYKSNSVGLHAVKFRRS